MAIEILLNINVKEVRIAFLENQILQDIIIERAIQSSQIGNIYKGIVTRILPGIQAAFVDINLERAGFLHVSDLMQNDSQNIEEILHVGQEVLVQVYKDQLGSKGARLTTAITLPARYLVFTPYQFQVTVSQKIIDEDEKKRLLALLEPTSEGGYIFRTAAVGISEIAIKEDLVFLNEVWQKIQAQLATNSNQKLIFEDLPLFLRMLRDYAQKDVLSIRVDDKIFFEKMQTFSKKYLPHLTEKIHYYSDPRPIFDIYSVEQEIQKALERKVYLKSGGHLIFDQTEAMATIDVNTGSYVGHKNFSDTIFKTNLEAVEVIARQVRLRNLGGIIIIDFIDMQEPEHQSKILQALAVAFANDPMRIEISEISTLGLVQLTRKRLRESLQNVLCVTCPHCTRRGMIKSFETLALEIFREIQRCNDFFQWHGFIIIAAKNVIDYLDQAEKTLLNDLENKLGKKITLRAEETYFQEQYDILPLDETRIS